MIKEKIIQAHNFSQKKHAGQKRKFTDLDYFTHPKWVARRIEELTNDEDLVITALLHDTIEDTDTTYLEVEKEFGKRIADLVQELTIDEDKKEEMGKKPYMVYYIDKMSNDAFIVKLVDRWHNVLFLESDNVSKGWKKWYWKETRYILDNLTRQLTDVQLVVFHRIDATLDYLAIQYNFS